MLALNVPQIKAGDIGFIMHNENKISRTMSWFMGSKWSHTFIVAEPSVDRTYICETSDFAVTVGWLERYLGDPNCDVEVYSAESLSPEMRRKIVDASMSKYNEVYGYLQLISLGVRCLLRRVGINIRNFIRVGLVCCHVPLYGYRLSNIPNLEGIDPESIDTEELYQIISKSPAFKLVAQKYTVK